MKLNYYDYLNKILTRELKIKNRTRRAKLYFISSKQSI